MLSGANWWAERHNPAMEGKMDSIGQVQILKSQLPLQRTKSNLTTTLTVENLYQASFYTLCNLFGEFPLVNERSGMPVLLVFFWV